MKYYSEKLNKMFDTEAALKDAEKALADANVKKEVGKKELAKNIEQAEINLDKAYQAYDDAKNEAARILDESNKQVIKILNDAKAKVAEAEKARTDAIVQFNAQFGVYRANYSGERAVRESNRVNKLVEDLFKMFPSNTVYNNLI
jgi:hypothetical protein